MSDIIKTILFVVALLIFVAVANVHTNKIKTEKCVKAGGTVVINISDATQSTCILKTN